MTNEERALELLDSAQKAIDTATDAVIEAGSGGEQIAADFLTMAQSTDVKQCKAMAS